MVKFRDLELDEIMEWPLVAQSIAIVVVMVVVSLIGYAGYILPKQERLEELKQQEQTLKSQIEIKAYQVAKLPQTQAQLERLGDRYELLLRQLPVQQELASLLASVNELGLNSGLNFTRIDWGKKQTQDFLYRLPLNIELTGSYHHIGDFSTAIAHLPRIINFDDVEWQRVSQESSTLHFKVRAYTYQLISEYDHD